jgi:hypothetical protein
VQSYRKKKHIHKKPQNKTNKNKENKGHLLFNDGFEVRAEVCVVQVCSTLGHAALRLLTEHPDQHYADHAQTRRHLNTISIQINSTLFIQKEITVQTFHSCN